MKTDHVKLAGLADKQLGDVDAKFMRRMTLEDGDMQEELRTQEDVGKMLRESGRPYQTDATPEFFWSQVSRRIDAAEAAQKAPVSGQKILEIFRILWAPAVAVAVVLGLVFFQPGLIGPSPYARVLDAKTSLNRVSVTPIQSKKAKVTVIWIEGLDYLPANPDILSDAG